MLAKFHAYSSLAFRGIWLMVANLFRRKHRGLVKFNENYHEDNIFPFSPEQREVYHLFSRCTGCGLCDTVCPLKEQSERFLFPGPCSLILSSSRSLVDAWAVDGLLDDLARCVACRECEKVCPSEVPITKVLTSLRAWAKVTAPHSLEREAER